MKLLPLDTPELIQLVAGWLGEPHNYQWLDFGNGVQVVNATMLRIMAQKDVNVLRAYTAEDDCTPVGVVGLSNVDRRSGTANVWVVLGVREFSNRGLPVRACSKIIRLGFDEMKLNTMQCWRVDGNRASDRIIRMLNFQPAGRLRRCHRIDGEIHDRLLFDLLPSEFREIGDA
jgi:RimJ/RimL family protein N-acetyltransferase